MDKSLVSICIPTYNGAEFLAEAMESAIQQTYSNFEIVISDDASIDNTLAIVESFKTKTKAPIFVHNHTPNGIGANWNYCIENANGKYIKLLFQDDVLMPTCIQENVNVLESDTSIGLVASKRDFIIDNSFNTEKAQSWIQKFGDLQANFPFKKVDLGLELNKSHFKNETLFTAPKNKIGEPPTVMFKKKIWEQIGGFDESLMQILDYEFYYRILKIKKIVVLNSVLVKFRLHQSQTTNLNNNKHINDYSSYERIIYDNFFKYLNWKHQFKLLIKHQKNINLIYKFCNKVFKKN